jgi:hypothetical protein
VRDAHLSIAVASLLDSTFRQVVCCAPPHMAKAIKEQFDTTEDFSSWSELCRILPAGRSLNQHRSCIGARNASLLLVVSEFLMLLILFSYELNTLAGLVSLPFRLASRVKWCITGSAAVRKSSLARSAASLWLQYPCLATTCCPGRCWRVLKPSFEQRHHRSSIQNSPGLAPVSLTRHFIQSYPRQGPLRPASDRVSSNHHRGAVHDNKICSFGVLLGR